MAYLASRIEYSEKYQDEHYEYRCVRGQHVRGGAQGGHRLNRNGGVGLPPHCPCCVRCAAAPQARDSAQGDCKDADKGPAPVRDGVAKHRRATVTWLGTLRVAPVRARVAPATAAARPVPTAPTCSVS